LAIVVIWHCRSWCPIRFVD